MPSGAYIRSVSVKADFVLTGEFSDYPIDMSDFTDASKCRLSLIRSTTT